jgi:hypothetical protein
MGTGTPVRVTTGSTKTNAIASALASRMNAIGEGRFPMNQFATTGMSQDMNYLTTTQLYLCVIRKICFSFPESWS